MDVQNALISPVTATAAEAAGQSIQTPIQTATRTATQPHAKFRVLALIMLVSCTLLLANCSRKFSVSVNQNVLYDPRPGHAVTVTDAGLQSCVNVAMRDGSLDNADDVQILACPALEIESLGGITQLQNLRYLDLAGNQLEHLDELRRLNRLSSVNAPNNALTDISGLLSIASLTSAVLTGNTGIPCDQLDTLAQKLGQNLLRPASCVE